jgi:hypothetical protein
MLHTSFVSTFFKYGSTHTPYAFVAMSDVRKMKNATHAKHDEKCFRDFMILTTREVLV